MNKVFLEFKYLDGTCSRLELGKVTVLKKKTDKVVFHLDRLPDGKHLLICSEEMLPDNQKLDSINFIREGE